MAEFQAFCGGKDWVRLPSAAPSHRERDVVRGDFFYARGGNSHGMGCKLFPIYFGARFAIIENGLPSATESGTSKPTI